MSQVPLVHSTRAEKGKSFTPEPERRAKGRTSGDSDTRKSEPPESESSAEDEASESSIQLKMQRITNPLRSLKKEKKSDRAEKDKAKDKGETDRSPREASQSATERDVQERPPDQRQRDRERSPGETRPIRDRGTEREAQG